MGEHHSVDQLLEGVAAIGPEIIALPIKTGYILQCRLLPPGTAVLDLVLQKGRKRCLAYTLP